MTTDLRELLREARDLLRGMSVGKPPLDCAGRIDAALSEPAPEPVAWRKILRLTDDEISILFALHLKLRDNQPEPIAFARAIELAMITRLVAAHAARPPASPSDAKVDWSWIRSVLSQGASIQQDYQAGKYPTYEHYAARLDEAARERMASIEREGGA